MAKLSDELTQEFKRLVNNSNLRRTQLFDKGRKFAEAKKITTLISGLLALLSASAITSTLTLFVGNVGIQILGAVSAAISGLCSLIASGYLNDGDVIKMLGGSSKYLALRERAHNASLNPVLTESTAFDQLTKFKEEYSDLDTEYAQYLPRDYRSAGHQDAGIQQMPPSYPVDN